jgi:hypothetical protein
VFFVAEGTPHILLNVAVYASIVRLRFTIFSLIVCLKSQSISPYPLLQTAVPISYLLQILVPL